MTCPLRACRICTGCAHSHHAACRRVVTCPDTGETNACECCGGGARVNHAHGIPQVSNGILGGQRSEPQGKFLRRSPRALTQTYRSYAGGPG
jgi:hypothetical protein